MPRKTFPIKRRYINADAAQAAIDAKIAALKGDPVPEPDKVDYDRERILGSTFKPAPFSDKHPAKKSGMKPKYQGCATPISVRQWVRMVGVKVDEPVTDVYVPKTLGIKPAPRMVHRLTSTEQLFREFATQPARQPMPLDGTVTEHDLRDLARAYRTEAAMTAAHKIEVHNLPKLGQGDS